MKPLSKLGPVKLTFRKKILLMSVSVLILTSFVYTYDAVRTERSIMRDEIIKKTNIVADMAARLGELPIISRNPELMKNALASLKNVSDITFAAFYDNNMNLLDKTGEVPPPVYDHQHSNEVFSSKEEKDYFDLCAPVFTVREKEDIDIFQKAEESRESKELLGWVRIGFSKASMNKVSQDIFYRGLLIAVAFTAISIFLLYKLVSVTIKPLALLSGAVKSVSNGKYPEVSVPSEDEIGVLTSEFNRMSKTIHEREEMLVKRALLSSFVSDIGFVLTGGNPLKNTLQHCTDIVITRLDAALARIWTCDEGEDFFRLFACSGAYTPPENNTITRECACEFHTGTTGDKLQSCRSNALDNLNISDREWARQNGIVSFICCPLIVEGKLIGVLEAFFEKQITDETFNALNTASHEIAIGIRRSLAELEIEASLREKEVLLKEIHHRVKNNMQVISSLLSLQSGLIPEKDQQYVEMLNEGRNRIRAMALVHEKLYSSRDLSNIDFNDYVTKLVKDLFSFYPEKTGNISAAVEAEGFLLTIDTAIPCGLIINELVSNSLKYAFPDRREGKITVSLKKTAAGDNQSDEYQLTVKDDGMGIPENLNIKETKTLGLQLITNLVEHQLQGTFELNRSGGTEFCIRFKELKYKKRI